MECPYPIYIQKHDIEVPCGYCGACIKRKISDWTVRCSVELKHSLAAYFITLTYADNPIQLEKKDLQLFFKRARKGGLKFKYFALGDYGDTFGRPHYHVLMFAKNEFDPFTTIQECWLGGENRGHGFTDVRPVTFGRIRYVVKYGLLARLDWNHEDPRSPPFITMSKRPAIGIDYLQPNKINWHIKSDILYFPDAQFKKALPRYYRNKIFAKSDNKFIAEMHKAKYLRERLERREQVLRDFEKQTSDPNQMYYDRLTNSANQFLDRLRAEKEAKKKIVLPLTL